MDFGIAGVAAITVIAYIVGLAARVSPLDNKWIPILCGTAGAALGVAGLYVMPDFPAETRSLRRLSESSPVLPLPARIRRSGR